MSGTHFDVNGAFGGGGFVSSSQSTQTQDTGFSPAKNRDTQVLLPLTVKQISDSILTKEDKSNFMVDGVEVNSLRLIAMVSNKLDRVSEVVLSLDDGTGRIDCHRWMNDSSESKEMEEIEQGMYVRVHGQLKGFQGKKNFVAFSVRPVTDFNEIAYHFIECIHVHVHNCRLQGGVQNQSHVTNSAMPTPVQNGSGYQPPASNQLSGRRGVEDMILGFLQTPANLGTGGYEKGMHIDDIAKHLNLPRDKILPCIKNLESEGDIYSTIDEWHFRSAQNG